MKFKLVFLQNDFAAFLTKMLRKLMALFSLINKVGLLTNSKNAEVHHKYVTIEQFVCDYFQIRILKVLNTYLAQHLVHLTKNIIGRYQIKRDCKQR